MKTKFKYLISGIMSAVMAINTAFITQIQAKSVEEVTTENLLGDVNDDGVVNALDVALLKNWISGKGSLTNCQNADLDGDGVINIYDWCLLKNNLMNDEKSQLYPVSDPVVIDVFKPCTSTSDEDFCTWEFKIYIKHQY